MDWRLSKLGDTRRKGPARRSARGDSAPGGATVLNAFYGDGNTARHARGLSGASEADPQQAGCSVVNVLNDDNPYAFHPGGAGAVMGDGRVMLMANEIDATVFAALVSRDGSEAVAGP